MGTARDAVAVVSLTGPVFLGLLVVLTLGAVAAVVLGWPWLAGRTLPMLAARLGSVLMVNALVLLTVMAQLNAHYLFYSGWGDLTGSLGRPARVVRGVQASTAAGVRDGRTATVAGHLPALKRLGPDRQVTYVVHGHRSGLTGSVLIRLPRGYTDPASATRRYPVLETFGGFPSEPAQWLRAMHLGRDLDRAEAARAIGPVIVVSPQVEFPAGTDTECVDGSGANPKVETWLAADVPYWLEHTLRVQPRRSSWATIGLSAGGWCAAMVTMLHPRQFSAAIVMGGYFRPDFGPWYQAFPPLGRQAGRYDLVALERRAAPPVALWVQTSRIDGLSYPSSSAMLRAATAPTAVTALIQRRVGHRLSVWEKRLPAAVDWLGANIPGFAARSAA